MSATNLLVAEPRNFCFKWRHQDGSTVEFNPSGWASDDPLKADWLSKMNELCSSKPAICPMVRLWLREYCELIDFQCSERIEANSPRVPARTLKLTCVNNPRLGISLLYLLRAVTHPLKYHPSPRKKLAASSLHRLNSAGRNRLVRDF
jgi:hypothetical protein